MRLNLVGDYDLIMLTYDEELILAQSIMDCISLRWVGGEFYEHLRNIYLKKAKYGRNITTSDLDDLVAYLDFYNIDHPRLVLDERSIVAPTELKGKPLTYDEQVQWLRDEVRQAWREIWTHHPRIKQIAPLYEVFPGDEDTPEYQEKQRDVERAFWEEVRRVQNELMISEREAFLLVQDYTPRGDLKQKDGEIE